MATALTPLRLSTTVLTSLGSPSAGDTAGNTLVNSGGKSVLYVKNGSTSRTLGVTITRTVNGQTVTPHAFTVGANFEGFYQLGATGDYGSTITVTPSHAEVTLKLIELS